MKTSLACFALLLVACSGSSSDVPDSESSSGNPGDVSSGDGGAPSSSGSGSADVGPPATAAECQEFGVTVCAKLEACDHIAAKILGGACEERYAGMCNARIKAPSTGFTTQNLAACGQAFVAAECEAAFGSTPLPACAFKGGLALDAACAFDEQCASGECSTNENICGKCVEPKPPSSPVVYAGLGETCDSDGKTAPRCNTGYGHACDPKTSKCIPIALVALSEPCGFIDGTLVMCAPGGRCSYGANASGTCVAETSVGDACTEDNECAFMTSCVAGRCGYATASDICK